MTNNEHEDENDNNNDNNKDYWLGERVARRVGHAPQLLLAVGAGWPANKLYSTSMTCHWYKQYMFYN